MMVRCKPAVPAANWLFRLIFQHFTAVLGVPAAFWSGPIKANIGVLVRIIQPRLSPRLEKRRPPTPNPTGAGPGGRPPAA